MRIGSLMLHVLSRYVVIRTPPQLTYILFLKIFTPLPKVLRCLIMMITLVFEQKAAVLTRSILDKFNNTKAKRPLLLKRYVKLLSPFLTIVVLPVDSSVLTCSIKL